MVSGYTENANSMLTSVDLHDGRSDCLNDVNVNSQSLAVDGLRPGGYLPHYSPHLGGINLP